MAGLPEDVRGGRRLNWSRVRQILESPVYVARPESGAPDILARPVGRWPALADDETFRRVQDRMEDHRRVPHQASGKCLLSGLLRCHKCGGRMHGHRSNPSARAYPRYRCQGERAGAAPSCQYTAGAASLDASVMAEVGLLLEAVTNTDPAFRAALHRAWHKLQHPESQTNVVDRARALEARIETLRLRVTRATERYCDNLIGKDEYDGLCARAQADIKTAMAERDSLPAANPEPQLPPLHVVLRRVGDWTAALRDADVAARRAVLAQLVEKATPVYERWGVYRADITWTQLGSALRTVATQHAIAAA